MNDILIRMSELKLRSQGELQRIYSHVHQLLTDMKERTSSFARDGTVRVSELRQYVEKIKFAQHVVFLLQKFTPLGMLLPAHANGQDIPARGNAEVSAHKNGKHTADNDKENNRVNGVKNLQNKDKIVEEDEASVEEENERNVKESKHHYSFEYTGSHEYVEAEDGSFNEDTTQEGSTIDASSADSSIEEEQQF